MSDLEDAAARVESWLQPLSGDEGPCGPDLEYDNDFLALSQAAAGKPETQFGPAESPDWRLVVESSEAIFDRTRDLRVAVLWLRGMLRLQGFGALTPGLRLVSGLMREFWDTLHPLPDPDDQDPYARVNALTVLRDNEGLIGDLRESRVIADRSIGEVTGRTVEVVLGLTPLREDETDPGRSTIEQMFAAALDKDAALRQRFAEAVSAVDDLVALADEKLGSSTAPDLGPLRALVKGIVSLLPSASGAAASETGEGAGADGAAGPEGPDASRGLSGAIRSREEAIRAIDMVCAFLERTEPTNPAPLFLRRARHLLSHNFLELIKVLAPDALPRVAEMVGVNPDVVEPPASP